MRPNLKLGCICRHPKNKTKNGIENATKNGYNDKRKGGEKMLQKKIYVSKTIRFDERISEDLGILAIILERTQNELVNIAVEDLILQNKNWFAKNIIVDFFKPYLAGDYDEIPEKFEWDDLKVTVNINADDSLTVHVDDPEEKFEKNFKSRTDYESFLRELASQYIDFNSESVKKYLDLRLNYK